MDKRARIVCLAAVRSSSGASVNTSSPRLSAAGSSSASSLRSGPRLRAVAVSNEVAAAPSANNPFGSSPGILHAGALLGDDAVNPPSNAVNSVLGECALVVPQAEEVGEEDGRDEAVLEREPAEEHARKDDQLGVRDEIHRTVVVPLHPGLDAAAEGLGPVWLRVRARGLTAG